jgi:hypothetical protein
MAFIVKSFFFTFIGAMLGPPWGLMALGVVLANVLLAARVPAVPSRTWRSAPQGTTHAAFAEAACRGAGRHGRRRLGRRDGGWLPGPRMSTPHARLIGT